jgi:hypothetical protein
MPTWSRARALLVRLAWRVPWLCLYAAGVWFLFRPAMHVFGRHLSDLWVYSRSPQHRYTAMSMLTGALTLHWSAGSAGHDEQIFNGAGYTQWGYGIPLLELPFHAIARHMRSLPARFFPDRAIFCTYVGLTIPIVWAGFDKLLASRERIPGSRLRRHVVSWTTTAFVLCSVLYVLMASRFIIYEETVAYFAMVQLVTMAAFIFAVDERAGTGAIVAFGVAAGIGMLVRQTGIIYVVMWAGLLLLERRNRRTFVAFGAALAPFVIFWLAANWVRTGLPWGQGFSNILPGYDKQIPVLRFGTLCTNTREHTIQSALRLFSALFMLASDDPKPWMRDCGFTFEPRNGDVQFMTETEPFLGMLALGVLVWTFAHHVVRRDLRITNYLPHAAVLVLFAGYVYAGAGFAWRYIADFWPLVVVAAVQYVRRLPRAGSAAFGWPFAAVMLAGAVGCYRHDVEPEKGLVKTLEASEVRKMWDDFSNFRWGMDRTMPSIIKCGEVPSWPWRNGRGWGPGCDIDTYSDVFVGLPPKMDDHYVLRLKTQGIKADSVRVYVNGRIYTARRTGDTFLADVSLHYRSFHSPIVLTTVEWVRALDPLPGKLLEVQLL